MDLKKLLRDIFTGNTEDLGKRFGLLGRRGRRLIHHATHKKMTDVELKRIPVVINNRNRYTYLKLLVAWLERQGMSNIIILDNDSTYPELLHYYSGCKHRIVKLGRNAGPRAIWECEELKPLLSDFYIYTDPDVVPDEGTSFASIRLMYDSLRSYLFTDKIGFALRIDNLPDHFRLKGEVIQWEKKFWEVPVGPQLFRAPVDTTFALYAPYAMGGGECSAMRLNFPHVALHMPWYEDTNQPTPENEYYRINSASANSHWTHQSGKK